MSTVTKPIMLDETGERIADALEELVDKTGTHIITITATATDAVPVENQTIKVYNQTSGQLYATLVYTAPTSLTVDVPDNFSYLIVPECTIPLHYVTDRPSGICTQNTTVTLTYKTIGQLSTFMDVKAALNAGIGRYVPIGSEVSFTHSTYGNIAFEIVDFDEENEVFTLLMKKVLRQIQFDATEATIGASAAISAGNYKFKNGNTYYYFTLTQTVPIGGQIKTTNSSFVSYSSGYDVSYLEKGSVSTTEIEGATDLGTIGADLNHNERISYGSNDYGECAIRQWFNGTGTNWWNPKTKFDRPPSYVTDTGFMSGVPANVAAVIDNTVVKCASQNTYCAPDSSHGKNQRYTVTEKFFLASQTEIYNTISFDDGSKQYDAYVGTGNSAKIKYEGSAARGWWLRTPYSNASNECLVNTSGSLDINISSSSFGAVAACKISKSI